MSLFIAAIDTNILFLKEYYYIQFKGYKIKYIPHGKEGRQDDLLLQMDGLCEERAFFLITELLSSLSFGLDAIFETNSGFINHIEKIDWKNMKNSTAGKRLIQATERIDDFIQFASLKNDTQVQLARLYRVAKSANNIYAQILFFWHCLCYNTGVEESKTAEKINCLTETIPQNLKVSPQDVEKIKKNKCLAENEKDAKNEHDKLGNYIHQCVRHSIAHIERDLKKIGKTLLSTL